MTQSGDRYLFSEGQTLTVTTTDVSKTYGQDATATVAGAYTITGLAPGVAGAFLGDTASTVMTRMPAVTSAGSAPTASAAGSPYAINASAGSLTALDGYSIAFANTGVLTIDKAALTVSIVGDPTKVYDWTTTAALASNNFAVSGFVAGQGATVSALTGAYNSANVANATTVTVALTGGDFTANAGTSLSNYTLPTTASGPGAITPRPITVTADDKTRIEAEPNSPLTYAITSGSLVNGDTLSGTPATTATIASLAGTYPITQGTLANPNYALTFIDGKLVVTSPDFGVSPSKFIPQVVGAALPGSGPTCPPDDVAAIIARGGSVVIFGPEGLASLPRGCSGPASPAGEPPGH